MRAGIAFLVAALAPEIAYAQTLGGGGDYELPLLRLVIGLILCTILAIVAAIALKRFMRGGNLFKLGPAKSFFSVPARKLRVMETQRLSPHADLCLFVCESRQYLVVVSPGGATLLHQGEEPKSEAAP